MLLIICLVSLYTALCGQPDVSRVFFKQADDVCVFRNVYDPHGYFKAYSAATNRAFYVTGHLASEEIYDYVISLQKRFPELPQIPIVVRKIASGCFTHSCFANPNCKAICYFDVTIDDMPLDPWRKFFLGHELGHFAYSKTHSFYAHDNKKSQWWIGNANWCQNLLLSVALAFELGMLKAILWREDISWWGNGFCACVVLMGVVRFWGYTMSGSCHEEELYCDAFALNTAQNNREKRLFVEAAKSYFLVGNSRWKILRDAFDSLVLTSTHPSGAYRIKMLEKEYMSARIH